MARSRTLASMTGRASRLVTLFALLAFAIQSFAVQTHIHGASAHGAAAVHHATSPARPLPNDPYDPANCPLCQEMLHAGVFVVPAPVLPVLLLTVAAFPPFFQDAGLGRQKPPHNWQSRAPPRR